MENISILDQIIQNKKAEEVSNLDAVSIINDLFGQLSERERDVLVRRHGLHSDKRETLESIGDAHNLTRERIRQIETTSVKKLQQLENLNEYVGNLKKIIYQLLEEHGGVMEKNYLLDLLAGFSLSGFKSDDKNEMKHKNYLNFLITKLLHNEFEEIMNSKYFKESYKLKYQDLEHLEEVVAELLGTIKQAKSIYTTENLIDLIKKLETYEKHKEKLQIEGSIDISRIFKNSFSEDNPELVNQHKTLYSLLRVAKNLEQNKFGCWGADDSREITPKTINDKIFLILKNHGKPMHFEEIANQINKIGFDSKNANPATVHNELILDDKYILVGRGLYGLREWGYQKGTVANVIEEVLNQASQPLSREEIIDKVLEKRMVKKATIVLALMNKNKFAKSDGKYTLKKD